ncbi:uncharacterized protein KQ657_002889 [Scheffersomyces spartinae]|uniref:Arrestin C-terminal-like domain-containing protein n=1 Tax=Scheffersomyces spartinae TaxID=45513 RepID=A0A9P8AG32_9ASCO|nr:uncharacterized protein KQ657_002889 [Scheffersomyces spartinae]KAG7191753.1 hypothetical protein KQ657_002889 [Scheffersomyces spartinae]
MLRRSGTPQGKHSSQAHIVLKNVEHDVLVLKGSEADAGSVLLNGAVTLAVTDPISVKKISVRLYSTLRLKQNQMAIGTQKGTVFEKKLYEYNWESSEFESYLNNLYENSSSSHLHSPVGSPPHLGHSSSTQSVLQKTHSSTSLKGLTSAFKSKSSSNLMNAFHLSNLHNNGSSTSLATSVSNAGNPKSPPSSSSHVLVHGNYEFPFSAILPGSMPESVEGLPGANVVYKIEAIIDRGKFLKLIIAKKHVRVVRTLTTDAVELTETVAVDNTWPKKVEYSLNVPAKAIAIGGGTPVSFMLVPMLKGLRLGDIKIQMVELYSYMGIFPPPVNGERIVSEKFIPKPNEDDPNFMMDRWEVDTFLKVPASLSKCTQDCDISVHMKVRHKIKFVIGLINPDDHVSELRASLPVQLFISPFLTVTARHEDDNASINNEQHGAGGDQEEVIFTRDSHNFSGLSLDRLAVGGTGGNEEEGGAPHPSSSHTSLNGFVAPPLYEKHIYDRLWNDISPIETPLASGYVSPQRSILSEQLGGIDGALLKENLRQLSIRQQQETSEPMSINGHSTHSINAASNSAPRDKGIFSLEGDEGGDYLTARPISSVSASLNHNLSHLFGPGSATPPFHLSRVNSDTNMNQVPSYSEAINTNANDEALSPAYEPPLPGSNINLAEINRRFEQLSANGSVTSVKKTLRSGRTSPSISRMSRSASQNSSPSVSRQQSQVNLGTSSKSHSRSGTNLAAVPEPQKMSSVVGKTTGSASFTMSGTTQEEEDGGGSSSASSASNSYSNSATSLVPSGYNNHHSVSPAHHDVPAHLLGRISSNGPLVNSVPEAHVHSTTHVSMPEVGGSSTTKLSLSASERKPLSRSGSTKSLHSLHNLSFLSKRKK